VAGPPEGSHLVEAFWRVALVGEPPPDSWIDVWLNRAQSQDATAVAGVVGVLAVVGPVLVLTKVMLRTAITALGIDDAIIALVATIRPRLGLDTFVVSSVIGRGRVATNHRPAEGQEDSKGGKDQCGLAFGHGAGPPQVPRQSAFTPPKRLVDRDPCFSVFVGWQIGPRSGARTGVSSWLLLGERIVTLRCPKRVAYRAGLAEAAA
jgi:hypothetical protein